MSTIKKWAIAVLPPVILSAYTAIRSKPKRTKPEWTAVQKGPIAGAQLLVNIENEGFQAMINGKHDQFFWDYLSGHDISGKLVIDVGAHIGYHSMAFCKVVQGVQRVIAYEPNVHNVKRFEEILNRNTDYKKRIEIRDAALSDQNGKANFVFSDNIDNHTSSGSHLADITPPQDQSVYDRFSFQSSEVELRKLDDEMKDIQPESIALIKIDVEGAEHLVLKGAEQTINQFKPMLLVEIHSVECMLEVGKILHQWKYDYEIIHADRPSRCFIACQYSGA